MGFAPAHAATTGEDPAASFISTSSQALIQEAATGGDPASYSYFSPHGTLSRTRSHDRRGPGCVYPDNFLPNFNTRGRYQRGPGLPRIIFPLVIPTSLQFLAFSRPGTVRHPGHRCADLARFWGPPLRRSISPPRPFPPRCGGYDLRSPRHFLCGTTGCPHPPSTTHRPLHTRTCHPLLGPFPPRPWRPAPPLALVLVRRTVSHPGVPPVLPGFPDAVGPMHRFPPATVHHPPAILTRRPIPHCLLRFLPRHSHRLPLGLRPTTVRLPRRWPFLGRRPRFHYPARTFHAARRTVHRPPLCPLGLGGAHTVRSQIPSRRHRLLLHTHPLSRGLTVPPTRSLHPTPPVPHPLSSLLHPPQAQQGGPSHLTLSLRHISGAGCTRLARLGLAHSTPSAQPLLKGD